MSDICCVALDEALTRSAANPASRQPGLEKSRMLNFSTGRHYESVIYRLHRVRKGHRTSTDLNDASYIIVNHCPFCGAKLELKPEAPEEGET